LVVVFVEPIVDVPVVTDVVVAVVPVVEVAMVLVIIVPAVSVDVPPGIADVEVMPVVDAVSVVAMVPMVSVPVVPLTEVSVIVVLLVSVLLVVDSCLQAKPNSATAAMVRKTRIVFFIFSSIVVSSVWVFDRH
jgi:hypothetical protein